MREIAQVEPMTTARALRGPFDYRLPEPLQGGAVGVGSMLVVPFGRREVLGVVVGLSDQSEVDEARLLVPRRALEPGVPPELVELARWLAREYCTTPARALALVVPPHAARRLGGRKRRAMDAPQHLRECAQRSAPASLTGEQRAALVAVDDALARERFAAHLLHGVTGSGKTEVYMQAAERVLERGRGVIVLVPEIGLTPQIVQRFVERFGETVAVLHSRLRPAQRYAEWRRLRCGEARVCVGPRSAVFAPVQRLGLIVVDEEHDASYKHEGDPRYDARHVAQQRAREEGALLLAGSATPRPESAHQLPRSRLIERVDGRPLPAVTVLDMCGQRGALHPVTAEALAELRGARGKGVVLLNRRGWSNFVSCRSCGRLWSCPQCDVSLVLHRAGGYLACHHCGWREAVPERCGECSSTSVARHGAGTERMAHELAQILDDGDFPVMRLDADAVAQAGGDRHDPAARARAAGVFDAGAGALLARFAAAECGVLIGTQMVAKGHDFPDLSLGVVLDADATLRFPDFRCEERTFALVTQLAGRVGRGREGHVLVQTMAPHARSIEYASRHDSDGFLASELEHRRALGYPPFSHLIRITCSAAEAAPARLAAARVRELLVESTREPAVRVLGPAALFRLRGRERQVLVLKASERLEALSAADAAVRDAAPGATREGVSFSVDVDPQ
jgi:primosomal protein N' (replication factor Y) (superfamily II helicase)